MSGEGVIAPSAPNPNANVRVFLGAKCTQSKSKCEGVFRPTTLQREDTFRT